MSNVTWEDYYRHGSNQFDKGLITGLLVGLLAGCCLGVLIHGGETHTLLATDPDRCAEGSICSECRPPDDAVQNPETEP